MFGFSQKDTEVPVNTIPYIYFHEDHPSRALDESKVGRKGLSLFKLRDIDVPIPAFFVVSPVVYKDLLFKAFDTKIVSLLENDQYPEPTELAKLIEKTSFEVEFQEELLKNYSRLSGFSDAWVSVRSSVIFTNRPEVSFSGIFSTELNVRGFDDLMSSIKEVYQSIFNDKVVFYARSNGIKLSELSMSVVVQKMVQAEVSGVAYTLDPITMDEKKMSVEAVFGLGDVIANGEITPDQYTIIKKDLSIVEKHIAPQEWMKIRKLTNKRDGKHFGSVERIQISTSWSHQQKLEDRFVEDVAKVALIVEDRLGKPQDLEWVWESGNVWVLQSKPVEVHNLQKPSQLEQTNEVSQTDGLMDLAVNIIKTGKLENKAVEDAMKYVHRESDFAQTQDEDEQKGASMVGMDLASRLAEYNNVVASEDAKVTSSATKPTVKASQEEVSPEVIAAVEEAYTPLPEPISNKDLLHKLDQELQKLSSMVSKAKQSEQLVEEKTELQQQIVEQYQEKKVEEYFESSISNDNDEETTMDMVASGIGSSSGVAIGEVRFMKSHADMKGIVTKKTILAINNYSLDMQPYVYLAGGVISQTGGLTSDLAIACREVGIPAVLGVAELDALVKDGDIVQIDGNFGSVYRLIKVSQAKISNDAVEAKAKELDQLVEAEKLELEKTESKVSPIEPVPAEKLPLESSFISKKDLLSEIMQTQVSSIDETVAAPKLFTATKVFASEISKGLDYVSTQSDGIFYVDLDAMIIENGTHPIAASEDGKFAELSKSVIQNIDEIAEKCGSSEVVISLGNASIGNFRALPRGKKSEDTIAADGVYGATRYLQNVDLLKKMLSIIKKARNVYHNRNISIAIHGPLNGSLMSEIKKEIISNGLRRTSTFNIYAVLETPAELILAQDILNAEIDGVIVNTPSLARGMQGALRDDKKVKYDLGSGNMLKMVNTAIESASGLKKKVVVICEDNKALVKHCVNKGVYGVAVNSESLELMKHLVADEELKLVLGK